VLSAGRLRVVFFISFANRIVRFWCCIDAVSDLSRPVDLAVFG
jgi:hypothetical protein